MRISNNNYFKAIDEVGIKNLPEVLQRSHTIIEDRTNHGKDWGIYEKDAEVKRVFDLAFEKLDEFIDKKDLSGTNDSNALEGTKNESEKVSLNGKPKIEYKTEVAFIKKFLSLEGELVKSKDLNGFIEEIQEAIVKRKITKRSPFAKDISFIQNGLVKIYNASKGNAVKINFKSTTKTKLTKSLEVAPKYQKPIFTEPLPEKIDNVSLKGLEGDTSENKINQGKLMSSVDFAELQFDSLGFKDKWLNLIGDPSPGFTAMVFGRPKMGKSYLCVDLAGYLARNHGSVLYVANEEKLDATLQMKLNDKDVKHENLFVSDYLPQDLSKYQFIILDSVNKLNLSPKDLENLKRNNPGKSFIYIFQTTKDGKFKGANSYQHDVDVVIEVPERGKATQLGRFNQGGEMNIFGVSDELSGIKQSEIEIEGELPVPLGELFIYVKRKGEKEEDIVSILDKDTERVITEVKNIVNEIIKKKKLNVLILDLEHAYNDSDNVDSGVAYFGIKLSGLKAELKKIAGEDKTIEYDWETGLAGGKRDKKNLEVSKKVSNVDTMKKKTNTSKDWTEPKFLNRHDWLQLKLVKKHYDEGNFKQAMNYASRLETILREEIPPKIWQDIGGELTPARKERLLSTNYGNRPDDLNPNYIFTLTATALLAEALRGGFDLKTLVRRELANRGQDEKGDWVGFDKAAAIHKIKK
jgi:hypothetical protein